MSDPMDEQRAMNAMAMPRVPINHVLAGQGEVLKLGHIICKVQEDGSRTDNRIGVATFTLPPQTRGPPAHWHEMHDEIFFVSRGTVRFHAPDGKHIDAKVGDTITVPTRAPHTFSNPFDEEAEFINTYTPAFYINYFKMLAEMQKGDAVMTPEKNIEAMSHFATLPAKEMM